MKKAVLVKLIIELDGKVFAKGFKITPKNFYKIFPKDDPFKQQDNLFDNENFVKSYFKVLSEAGYRTLMIQEKIGYYDKKFDFKKYHKANVASIIASI